MGACGEALRTNQDLKLLLRALLISGNHLNTASSDPHRGAVEGARPWPMRRLP